MSGLKLQFVVEDCSSLEGAPTFWLVAVHPEIGDVSLGKFRYGCEEAEELVPDLGAFAAKSAQAINSYDALVAALEDKQWAVITEALDRYNAGKTTDLAALGIIGQGVLRLDELRRAALTATKQEQGK